jgi:hypothetical protein
VLLWALPELYAIPAKSVRALFYVVLVVVLTLPSYYAIAGIGLPWISVRRLVIFPLILCFALVISGSRAARAHVRERLAASKAVAICVVGLFVMVWLSVLTSAEPAGSLSPAVDATLMWFVPFFTLLYFVKDEIDMVKIVKIIAWCSVFVSIGGVVDFILQRRIFLSVIPAPMLNALMENNPSFQMLVNRVPMRNGVYRATSLFATELSFSQFDAMIIPLGLYLLIHGGRGRDRALGWLVVIAGLLGMLASGARGGWVALLAAMPTFAGLWVVRAIRVDRSSLVPSFVLVFGGICFTALVTLILAWGKLRVHVFGGSETQASDQARWDQWHMALPHIAQNPLTGHGFGVGADVVGYYVSSAATFPTLDSTIISMLVETGIPGFLFYYGALVFAIAIAARRYVLDSSPRSALGVGLACALISYTVYSFVLSARENQTLLFLLLGSVVLFARRGQTSEPRHGSPTRSLNIRRVDWHQENVPGSSSG